MQVPCVGWIIPDVDPFLRWLVEGAVGPTAAGLPVTWAASDLASAARRWFRRRRHSDGLSRIVKAASGTGVDLTADEFDAVSLLLEQESTWVLAGRGTVEDLASWIASCLTARPSSGRFAAGLAVAHGILEFAVRDLEPQWFQQVVFARLDRIRTEQAATLDHLMAAMHADMTALVALQKATTAGFLALMSALARVLDRMPGPADHGQVAVYLAVLARWLSTDPWLASSGAAHLAPASIERKLTVASADRKPVMADADDLAHRCIRLVILGEPGSGKTWLARRAARLSAEAALKDLADGKTLDEVELPLYVTCARLAAAPPGDVIRRAVVSSALGHLPDLGAARLTEAVRTLFEERQSATMLVADSLDEARGADDRVRLIDSLPDKWRIVLTSRPGAWQQQLHIGKDDSGRQVGTLQPLRYPEDVEPVIERWLAGNPASAADLSRQLRARPALQQTATVPLILAFYCIASGDRPLPTLRRDLYDQVLRRMLAGRWRGNREREIDPDACLSTLCAWAWSAAEADTISGIGTWSYDFLTYPVSNHGHD